jgi:hypothetical protein
LIVAYGALWLFVVLASPETNLVVEALTGVGLVIVFVWGSLYARSAGVCVDEYGIVNRSLFRSRRYEWTQLAAFEDRYIGTKDCVYARLIDGNRRRLSLLQGQTVLWDNGETKDIVGLLNQELAERSTATEAVSSERQESLRQ